MSEAEKSRYRLPQADHIKKIIKTFGGPTEVAKIIGTHRSTCYAWALTVPGDHALKLYLHAKRYKMGVRLEDLKPEIFKKDWTPTFSDNAEQ